jgi:predicted site-specific integrase-resolvase
MQQQMIFNQKEAARIAGVTTRTLRRWTTEGRLKTVAALPGAYYHINQLSALGAAANTEQEAAA